LLPIFTTTFLLSFNISPIALIVSFCACPVSAEPFDPWIFIAYLTLPSALLLSLFNVSIYI
jgi:hypothetical protein